MYLRIREEEHGLRTFQTQSYRFHYLEVPSGIKFIINTDLEVNSLQSQLWDLYKLFVEMVVRNPNWEVNECINMPSFTSAVDKLLCDHN